MFLEKNYEFSFFAFGTSINVQTLLCFTTVENKTNFIHALVGLNIYFYESGMRRKPRKKTKQSNIIGIYNHKDVRS